MNRGIMSEEKNELAAFGEKTFNELWLMSTDDLAKEQTQVRAAAERAQSARHASEAEKLQAYSATLGFVQFVKTRLVKPVSG